MYNLDNRAHELQDALGGRGPSDVPAERIEVRPRGAANGDVKGRFYASRPRRSKLETFFELYLNLLYYDKTVNLLFVAVL